MLGVLVRILHHDRLAVRVAGAVGVGYALFFLAWSIGYSVLPEGVLRGQLSGGLPMVTSSPLMLAVQIVGFNLLVPGLVLVLLSRMQVGRFSLGYNVPFANMVLYGLWLGTNSFQVPMPERMEPTLTVFWQRSGPYEMLAFTLMAAVLARSARVRQVSFWSGPTVPVPPAERGTLGLPEYIVLALALAMLVAANVVEAGMLYRRLSA